MTVKVTVKVALEVRGFTAPLEVLLVEARLPGIVRSGADHPGGRVPLGALTDQQLVELCRQFKNDVLVIAHRQRRAA